MRAFLCLLVLAVSGAACAQADLGRILQDFAGVLRERGLVKPGLTPIQDPLEPQGFPGPPAKSDLLPPAREEGEDDSYFEIVSAPGKTEFSGDHITYKGGVHARYKGYELFADEIDGDRSTDIYNFRGNVVVVARDQVIEAEAVTINFNTRTYEATGADIQLNPSFFPSGNVQDPVYVNEARSTGTQNRIHSHNGGITTCNLEHPHYIILSRQTDVRPTRRIVMRKVSLEVLGKRLFTLPYLSIPLDERAPRYMPEIGQSQDEGYYVKFRLPIDLHSEDRFLDAKFDYFTKLGTGVGGDFAYYGRNMEGRLNAYTLIGPAQRTIDISSNHTQHWGRSDITLDNSYQRQNYLVAPENTLLNSRINMNIPQRNGTVSSLSFSRSSNTSDTFSSVQQTWQLTDQRNWSNSTRTTLELALPYSSSSFPGGDPIVRREADVHVRAQHDLRKATAEFEYRRAIPIGDTTNFFTQPDLTPVFYLRSDAGRLFGSRWANELPFSTELSLGEFTDTFLNDQVSRGNFEVNMSKPDRRTGRAGIGLDGRYKQSIYSDDTAQYVVGLSSAARYDLGRDTGINLRYNFLEPHGFSPLQFDRTGESNFASLDVSFEPVRNLLMGAQTGYDFLLEQQQETAWQSVGLRSEWTPNDWFQLRSLATYDTFQKGWSNIRLDLGWQAGATTISAGARYDGIRHTWGNLNLYIDGLKWGRLKASTILNYNGYLKQFEARHFSFTYDLHCAELMLQIVDNPTGFRPGRQVSLFLRLKAFPFDTPFGTGTRGQPIGTGTGRDGF